MFPIRDHNPSGQKPVVTYALIVANVLIFFSYAGMLGQPVHIAGFFGDWAMIPARISGGDGFYTLFSSMYLHGGWLHLAGNMLFLWIFGDNVEDKMGRAAFLRFYLLAGVAAAGAQYLTAPLSDVPMVGASGAIAGVMGAYLLLFPKARVDVLMIFIIFFRIFAIPAWAVLILWFAMQFLGGIGSNSGAAGVAYWAHAGGFAAGLIMCLPLWQRLGGQEFWRAHHGHPPHPVARYSLGESRIPKRRKRRGPWG